MRTSVDAQSRRLLRVFDARFDDALTRVRAAMADPQHLDAAAVVEAFDVARLATVRRRALEEPVERDFQNKALDHAARATGVDIAELRPLATLRILMSAPRTGAHARHLQDDALLGARHRGDTDNRTGLDGAISNPGRGRTQLHAELDDLPGPAVGDVPNPA